MFVYLRWQRRQRCLKSATSRKYLFCLFGHIISISRSFCDSEVIDCESHPNPILCILRIWTYYVSFAKFGIATPPSGGRGFKARILRYLYPSSTGWCITMGSTDSCMMVLRPCVLRNNCLAVAQTMQQLYKPTNNCINPFNNFANDATWQLFMVNSAAERLSVLSGRITLERRER